MSFRLTEFVHRRQFNPMLLGIFLTPFYLSRLALWREVSRAARAATGRLLDVGCGTKPYRQLFNVTEYIGLDIDSNLSRRRNIADYLYDGTRFPFESHQFDVVLCNQVLEHVFNPEMFVAEVSRMLKPGGLLILTVPFVWDEHEQPYDYARYTSFGLRALLCKGQLEITKQRKTLADASVFFQLINAYLYKVLSPRQPAAFVALSAIVFAPISAFGWILGHILPRNPDFYLDQVVVARRKDPTRHGAPDVHNAQQVPEGCLGLGSRLKSDQTDGGW